MVNISLFQMPVTFYIYMMDLKEECARAVTNIY